MDPQNKNFVIVHSDSHGTPPLIANHLAPVAPDLAYNSGGDIAAATHPALRNPSMMIDALDYYGFWKLFDGLCDAAFFGTDRQYALGNTPEQRNMGKWSRRNAGESTGSDFGRCRGRADWQVNRSFRAPLPESQRIAIRWLFALLTALPCLPPPPH